MKYFVTGATGFIGGRLARRLIERGDEVRALVRTPEKAVGLRDLGVAIFQGDITFPETLHMPMTGVDGVFHIAAWYKVGARDRADAEQINVEGTRNVLAMMRELAIPRGVYTSTLAVFGDTHGRLVDESYRAGPPWLSEYDRTKWLAHYEVADPMMRAGLSLVIVQPGLVYGPGDTSSLHDSFAQYLRGRLPITPLRTAFCWGHVDDTVEGHLLAMERGEPGETYIIGGPPYTLRHAFEMAERITGVRAPRLHPGPRTMRAMAALMGVVGRAVPVPDTYTAESLRVLAGVTYLGDNSKARRELGFESRSLEAGLPDALDYELRLLRGGAGL